MEDHRTSKGGSHVVTIPLRPRDFQVDDLETRFDMARRAYNCARDEWLKRRRKYHQHPVFQDAVRSDLDDGARQKACTRAMKDVGFGPPGSEGQITADDKNGLFEGTDEAYHLNAEMIRRVGGMAAEAVWRFHCEEGYGKPGVKHDPPPLVACNSGIELRRDPGIVRVGGPRGGARALDIQVESSRLEDPKIRESLSARSAYPKAMVCRVKGSGRTPMYLAKLTCKGPAPLSPDTTVREGVVGVDIGPSMVAAVGGSEALLRPILDRTFVDEYMGQLDRLDRKLDRQRRANNPERFDEQGRVVGSGRWTVSNRQRKTYVEHDEAYRVMREERKRQHYELAKRLLELGNHFVVEDNQYRGWQAGLFGSQVGDFAPAAFVDRLEEKAQAAGGWVRRVSTWDTALSQRCVCGRKAKKDLSQRRHECECGVSAQRDLFSAFLARYCVEGELDADQAREDWSRLEPALQSASSESSEAPSVDSEKPPGEGLEGLGCTPAAEPVGGAG